VEIECLSLEIAWDTMRIFIRNAALHSTQRFCKRPLLLAMETKAASVFPTSDANTLGKASTNVGQVVERVFIIAIIGMGSATEVTVDQSWTPDRVDNSYSPADPP